MRTSKVWLCVALGILIGTGLGCSWFLGGQGAALGLHGTVEIQEVRLSSKVGGRVAEVLVREGDLVEPAQVLVRFEAPELAALREQSMARVQAAGAALNRAIAGARPEEREAARAGVRAAQARFERLRAGARGEEIRQAEAELKREEASLALARKELNRNEWLMARSAVSASEFDTAKAECGRALARVEAARAHLELLVAGSRKEEVDEAAAELARARANAALLENGTRAEDIAQAEAALAEAQGRLHEVEAQLDESSIRAPERAVVEVLSVRRGDVVPPNQAILRVLRADDLWVKAYVPETDLGRVRLGQGVALTIDGYPGRHFAGTVTHVAAESEFLPRNVQSVEERRHQVFAVKVRVADPDGLFKSGMAAEVHLPLEPASRGVRSRSRSRAHAALAREGR
jgi:multidrug resistance efflux pump